MALGTVVIGACVSELDETESAAEIIGSARGDYGVSVSVSGPFAVVGQPQGSWDQPHLGSAYIYEWREGAWIESAVLRPHQRYGESRFGTDVAIEGEVAAVGASDANHANGAVYIFERFGGEWTQVARLTAENSQHLRFGQSVALSGDYLLVGAPADAAAGENTGAVYVFQRQQSVWWDFPVQKLIASDAAAWSGFGTDIAMMGPDAVVGAPHDDDREPSNRDYGAAYMFELDRGVWLEVAKLQAGNQAGQDKFGHAVSLLDDEVLIGAPGHDGTGAAYLFKRESGIWSTAAHQLIPSVGAYGDQFGAAVALTDRFLLIGADESTIVQYGHDHLGHDHGPQHSHHYHRHGHAHWQGHHIHDVPGHRGQGHGHLEHQDDRDDDRYRGHRPHHHEDDHDSDGKVPQAGAVYIFERQGTDWSEVDILTPSHARRHAHFGFVVALDGDHALAGAPAFVQGGYGRVYAYRGFQSNAAPEILSTPIDTARVGELYQYAVVAIDADEDPLTYALTAAPSGMQIDAVSGLIEWTPTASEDVTVEVEVNDGLGGRATQTFIISAPIISASLANQAPRIISTPITRAEPFHLVPEVSVTDAYLAHQTITLNGKPYTPGTAITSAGAYELTIEATDEAGNTSVTTLHFTLETTPLP
jgi:hypothetical protein